MGRIARVAGALALALSLAFALAGCGQQGASSGTSTPGAASDQQQGELYGSPWTTSIFTGNLPDSAPEATDDLYLHYAYDYIAAHQDGSAASVMTDAQDELQEAVTAAIGDSSLKSPGLEQLRIFYEQAHDLDALAKAGADELRPYLKAVADTKSLSELEAVMLSDDFPFSPWIDTAVSAFDMNSTMCTAVMPKMLFSDRSGGSDVYEDSGDEAAAEARELQKVQRMVPVETSAMLVSLAEDQAAATELVEKYFELEKRYGKENATEAESFDAEYGSQAEHLKLMSADELKAACPHFPIVDVLAKSGKDAGKGFIIMYPAWLSAFNEVWTDDNFELLRGMTQAKVLAECAPYLDPSYYATARAQLGISDPTADEFAWSACDTPMAFAQLLGQTYVEQTLGETAVDDLTQLANDLIDTSIDLVKDTPWLADESREAIMDKLDDMALNILYPDGGYFDYGDLKLTPTDKGGTLFGNYLALNRYNEELEAKLIGQPARASAVWLYSPPTEKNCSYDRISNSINIFPGFVTSTLYKPKMAEEELLGGIGFVIGHEISHAFDYNGSQLNGFGEPTPVFTGDDVSEYVEKCRKLADYYETLEVTPGVTVDGESTVMEATADLCGMQVVLERAKAAGDVDRAKLLAHLAYTWAAVYPKGYEKMLLAGAHAPSNLRVNVSAQMCDGFYEALGATEGGTMYLAPEKRVAIWGKGH